MTLCRQTMLRSLSTQLILICLTQTRDTMAKKCTILYVMQWMQASTSFFMRSTVLSSNASKSSYYSLYLPMPPIDIKIYFSALLNRPILVYVDRNEQQEVKLATCSCFYLIQDCTKTMSGLTLAKVQFSNYFLLNSCELPSLYLTKQKGQFQFILCYSMDWINNFWSLCSTYFMNFILFFCKRILSSLSVKCDGSTCYMYFSWMNYGFIQFRIYFWNFYSSISLYCFLSLSMVRQMAFVGSVPSIFLMRPSLISVWNTLRMSPSMKQISGMQILSDGASRLASPFRIFSSHESEFYEHSSKYETLPFFLCIPFFCLQTRHSQFSWPHSDSSNVTVISSLLSPLTILLISGVQIFRRVLSFLSIANINEQVYCGSQ